MRSVLGVAAGLLAAAFAPADVVTLNPVADNTLYEATIDLSNGAGTHCFVGNNRNGERRRAILRFNLTTIPPGSRINGAQLTLSMTRTLAGGQPIAIHRCLSGWSEGTDDAPSQEGGGANATAGSTTWFHRNYNAVFWTTPGGDFDPAVSASISVSGQGSYTWTGAGLAADVKAWVDTPATNFGWILTGNESTGTTAKRFETRESTSPPRLQIDFTPPCIGDLTGDRVVDELDLGQLLSAWQSGAGGDVDGDGDTDESDLGLMLAHWLAVCP
ncbi:MAG: DNRLRE domain-containing protein [Phycisphaerae bacterium]